MYDGTGNESPRVHYVISVSGIGQYVWHALWSLDYRLV